MPFMPTNIDELYAHYQKSTGVTEDPFDSKKGRLYFALKDRKPNTMMHLFVWHSWRMMELYAPALRKFAVWIGQKTRWAPELEAALDRRYEGNAYVKDALSNGAAYAVVDNPRKHYPPKTILVEDSTDALYELAKHHRKNIDFPIVAITGTMGKTTTTNLIQEVLSSEINSYHKNGRNSPHAQAFNVLNMPVASAAAVCEMGTVRPTIIRSSCEILRPTHGLITAVDLAHLDTFGNLNTIKRSKWELCDFLVESGGQVFLNMNHPWLASQAHRVPNAIRYGSQPDNDVIGELVSADPFLKVRWFPKNQKGPIEIQTNLAGQHNLDNVLGAIAVGVNFGISPQGIKKGIESLQPVEDRSDIFYSGSNMIYNESFSSTPASTRSNLKSFSQFTSSHKVLIMGPISRTPTDHPVYDEIVDLIEELNFDQVIFLSQRYDRYKSRRLGLHMNGRADVKAWLDANPLENAAIMIKAYSEYGLKSLFK